MGRRWPSHPTFPAANSRSSTARDCRTQGNDCTACSLAGAVQVEASSDVQDVTVPDDGAQNQRQKWGACHTNRSNGKAASSTASTATPEIRS